MHPPRPRHLATAAVIALALTAPAVSDVRAASVSADQRQIDAYLRVNPGGKQINANQISYGNGAFIVTVPGSGVSLAASACPSGWFCFYDQSNFGGYRGQLSSCGWQDLAWYGWSDRTHSVRYSLPTGYVWFINHAGSSGHGSDVNLFWVGVSRTEIANVSPNQGKADHVRRTC